MSGIPVVLSMLNNKNKQIMTNSQKINFFEGSYSFKSVTFEERDWLTTLEEVVETFKAQYNYRPTSETLWCEITHQEGKYEVKHRARFDATTKESYFYMKTKVYDNDYNTHEKYDLNQNIEKVINAFNKERV